MPEPLAPASLEPFDLTFPPYQSVWPCMVCGEPLPEFAPFRNPLPHLSVPGRPSASRRAPRDGHESCRAKTSEWGRQVDLLADDPEFVAASAAADEAWQAADALWHAKVDALDGPPDWFKRTRSSPMEGRCEC